MSERDIVVCQREREREREIRWVTRVIVSREVFVVCVVDPKKRKNKVLPGLEPGLQGSKPWVLTNYTKEPLGHQRPSKTSTFILKYQVCLAECKNQNTWLRVQVSVEPAF